MGSNENYRRRGLDVFEQAKAVALRHADVKKETVRLQSLNGVESLLNAFSLPANLDITQGGELLSKALSGQGFIVDEDYAEHGLPDSLKVATTWPSCSAKIN